MSANYIKVDTDEMVNRQTVNNLIGGFSLQTYYVSSTQGSDTNDGLAPNRAFASVMTAIGKVSAESNAAIVLLPNHEEEVTSASAILLDKDNVTIIGIGSGTARPKFTFTTSTDASMQITGDNCRLDNVVLLGSINALTGILLIDAAYCTLNNLHTEDDTACTMLYAIVAGQTTDADYLHITDWTHTGTSTSNPNDVINVVAGVGVTIETAQINSNLVRTLVFGSSTTTAIGTNPANKLALRVTIVVSTPFNGSAPTVSIGDSGDHARLMATTDNNLKTAGVYQTTPAYLYGAATTLNAYFTPDSSTAGAALIFIEIL